MTREASDPETCTAHAGPQQEAFWAEAWHHHLERYLAAPPRVGYWLLAKFSSRLSTLEIAGGSCRDSLYLARRGVRATATDFDTHTLNYLACRFSLAGLELRREDAFAMSLRDKSVDLSFSNGFWIYVPEDENLHRLIREQARVTRKYLVSLVHNGENPKLVAAFARKAIDDKLYDIRFFDRRSLRRLVETADIRYRSLSMQPFGGFWDCLYQPRLKSFPNPLRPLAPNCVPWLYGRQAWHDAERIACIVELE